MKSYKKEQNEQNNIIISVTQGAAHWKFACNYFQLFNIWVVKP